MSLDEYRGAAWAFAELMKRAKADIARDQAKSASVSFRSGPARKDHVGWFAAKVWRRAVGWRRERTQLTAALKK